MTNESTLSREQYEKAEINGISRSALISRIKLGWDVELATNKPVRQKESCEYAVYRGDELLVIGSAEECANRMGWKTNTIYCYLTPYYEKRIKNYGNDKEFVTVTKLEDDE